MIDIRYHVTSLIAVFLALAIGILVGSSVAPGTARNLTAAVNRQSLKVTSILAEQERQSELLKSSEQALLSIVSPIVKDKLSGHRVAIIQTSDQADALDAVRKALDMAGATVSSVTTILPDIEQVGDDDLHRIFSKMPDQSSTGDPDSDLLRPVAAALIEGEGRSQFLQTDMAVLDQERLIETSGDYDASVSLIVVIGGIGKDTEYTPSALEARQSKIIDLMKKSIKATIVGVEETTATSSSIAVFQKEDISSVDCIDRPVGQLDLIYALLREKGGYGVLPSAEKLTPETLTEDLDKVRYDGRMPVR
jgi:hypothetical protein